MCLSKELDTIKIEFWNKVFVLYQSELPVQKKKKKLFQTNFVSSKCLGHPLCFSPFLLSVQAQKYF